MLDGSQQPKLSREDRIRMRRERVERKQRKDQEIAEGKSKPREEQKASLSLSEQQIADSLALLDHLQTETTENVTNIQKKCDEAESARRILEEHAQLERYDALQVEAVTCGRKQAAISMRWADLLSMKTPQDIHAGLQQQKILCQGVIDSKDRRLREFETEMKNKDEEYVKNLKVQGQEVTTIIDLMRKQYSEMKKAYHEQLKEIEKSFMRERSDLLASQRSTIDALFEARQRMEETEFMAQRRAREKAFQKKLEEVRASDADAHARSKTALERSIQDLEQHLERMLATYQLNKEKLDYNLQVLTERHTEFKAIQSTYKNRQNRLRESMNNLKSRYHNLDKKYKDANDELTEEYKRLTRQVKDLQEKLNLFELADEKKFREIWEMNELEVRALIARVLEADRNIHEQQLGLEWTPPREEQLSNELETFSESGTNTGKSTSKISDDSSSTKGRFSSQKVKQVLDLVVGETQFLLDAKIREAKEKLPPEQAAILQVDAILRYIGVESQEDVDRLVNIFFKGQDDDDETLMADPDDVLKCLKEFSTAKDEANIADVAPQKKKKSSQQTGGESEADRKARRRREERKFWERMAHVLPEINKRIWKALDEALQKYYRLLQQRADGIDEAVRLQKQNEELKQLMDQYLQSRVNEELQVPPTHVIRITSGAEG